MSGFSRISGSRPSGATQRPIANALITLAAYLSLGWTSPTFCQNLTIDRTEYQDQMVGFWLAQSIANWTGLQTEHRRNTAPFYTDGNWADPPDTDEPFGTRRVDFVFNTPVWKADDDTDIEYVYLHLMDQYQTPELSPEQIRSGWVDHINRFIWVSNDRARDLMGTGVSPRVSGMQQANFFGPRIDAQLTTEIFGALAPGMPAQALQNGLTPMMATSRTHATHAAQYFALLHSLAPAAPEAVVNAGLGDQLRWASDQARDFIPDTSKVADIIDFVHNEYDTHTAGGTTNLNDWENTRDAIHQRYQVNATANGFRYRGSTESSVNLATGVMALLYGDGDLKRTIQIGTLSGWDADNPTASVAAVIGQLLGEQGVRDAFPDQDLSLLYNADRTRDLLPDRYPTDDANDGDAEDTFTMMAQRMMGIIDQVVVDGGGHVDSVNDQWVIPPIDFSTALSQSATHQLQIRSANYQFGTSATPTVVTTDAVATAGSSNNHRRYVADGLEFDFSGIEPSTDSARVFNLKTAAGQAQVQLTIEYPRRVDLSGLVFLEGNSDENGGWFDSLTIELKQDGVWVALPAGTTMSEALDPAIAFQWIDFDFGEVATAIEGLRLTGTPGDGNPLDEFAAWASVSELDGLLAPDGIPGDANRDGRVSLLDLDILGANWQTSGAAFSMGDFSGDGLVSLLDLDILGANWGTGEISSGELLNVLVSRGFAVPEPSVTLIVLSWVGVAQYRRRNQKTSS